MYFTSKKNLRDILVEEYLFLEGIKIKHLSMISLPLGMSIKKVFDSKNLC